MLPVARDKLQVNLVATALEHGIGGILTANVRDFAPFAGLLHIEQL